MSDDDIYGKSAEFAEEALALAASIHPLLANRLPHVQGAALADLLATWLSGHIALDDDDTRDEIKTNALRDQLLAEHIVTVRALIKHNDERSDDD